MLCDASIKAIFAADFTKQGLKFSVGADLTAVKIFWMERVLHTNYLRKIHAAPATVWHVERMNITGTMIGAFGGRGGETRKTGCI